jgi:hypothetical protein
LQGSHGTPIYPESALHIPYADFALGRLSALSSTPQLHAFFPSGTLPWFVVFVEARNRKVPQRLSILPAAELTSCEQVREDGLAAKREHIDVGSFH